MLSVTAPIEPVPESLVIVTVAPPMDRLPPQASFARTVSTWVEVPLAVIDAEVGVRVEAVASAAAPAV